MRKRVGYAKLGRSMQLDLANCGSLGGDVEIVPTLQLLAERHPDVDFYLIGRNSGEDPAVFGLPSNVKNPWIGWAPEVRRRINDAGLNYSNLSIEDHVKVKNILCAVTGDTIASMDHIIMWLGQHGTTNTPIPTVGDRSKLTKPYDWATLYASYLIQGINRWRDEDPLRHEEVLLNSDVRNYVKYRDMKWPLRHPVLAQYTYSHRAKHERFGAGTRLFSDFGEESVDVSDHLSYTNDGEVWQSRVWNTYSRIEVSSLIPGTPFGDSVRFNADPNRAHRFGMIVNETRRDVNPGRARLKIINDWALPQKPGFIRGHWHHDSQQALGVSITPVPIGEYFQLLQSARTTLTTPASGSHWATAKPWESFAAGTVCFFHPDYDDQDNVLGDAPAELRDFLRVKTVRALKTMIELCGHDDETWLWAISAQRAHFNKAVRELRHIHLIEERLGLGD